jgi:DNA-binding transcriptional ArsR family regulator
MANNDSDLFDRLRRAGLRKQVAKTLSEIDERAGKKALRIARGAAADFRALAEELERRLPSVTIGGSASVEIAGPTGTSTPPAAPTLQQVTPTPQQVTPTPQQVTPSASHPAASDTASGARQPATKPRRATGPAAGAAPARRVARAPRGANKAKILESLEAGPKAVSEIAEKTGIGAGTVSSTLTKMVRAGEIVKAGRAYRLPG